MNNNYIVYKHTCSNGKVYIGITCQNPKERWRNGHGYRNNNHFFKAIQKYGWNNIEHKIVYKNLTQQEAEEREKYLIYIFDSTNRKYGYNIQLGGSSNNKHSDKTKEKIRQANAGKKLTEETKIKISNSNKGKKGPVISKLAKEKLSRERTGNGNPMYGKHHTEESRAKIRKNNKKSRKVVCLNNNKVFNTAIEAAHWAQLKTSTHVIKCCKKQELFAGKHPDTGEKLAWRYYEEVVNE